MKYVALGMAVLYAFIWLYGGIYYSIIGDTKIYYFLGWVTLLAYLPLYWYRSNVEDKRHAERPPVSEPPGLVMPGPQE
jgi:hypothetical protein